MVRNWIIVLAIYGVGWILSTVFAVTRGVKSVKSGKGPIDKDASKSQWIVFVIVHMVVGLIWPFFVLINFIFALAAFFIRVGEFKLLRVTEEEKDWVDMPWFYGVAYEKLEAIGDGYGHNVYWLPIPLNVIVGTARAVFLDLRSGFIRQGTIERMMWRAYMAGRWRQYEYYFGSDRDDRVELRIYCGDCGEVITSIGLDEPFRLEDRYDALGGVCTYCQVDKAAKQAPSAGPFPGILRRKSTG